MVPIGRDSTRHARRVRLCGQGGPDRRGAAGDSRRDPGRRLRRSRKASRPANWWSSMAPTSCKDGSKVEIPERAKASASPSAQRQVVNLSRPFILRPVATCAADGRIAAGRRGGLPAAAGVGVAASGLSDHPGRDVLPGRQPGRHGLLGDRSSRAPVRADARLESDDVEQLRRQLGHHAAVQP